MKYVVEYNDLYISACYIDGYDNELNINFTSKISNAKNYNEEDINTIKNILLIYFADFKIIGVEEKGE